MRHLDLFSGIGGFALAASWVWPDHEIVGFCEIDNYCRRVLAKHWPGVPIAYDIKTLRGHEYTGIDLLTGGFPCQPYSDAGKRKGAADDRALWPEMLRVIAEARPRWVCGENVAGIVRMELDRVLLDLESEGYTAWPIVIPACAVDAPHRRDRVWIVAHRDGELSHGTRPARDRRAESSDRSLSLADDASKPQRPHQTGKGERSQPEPRECARATDVADTNGEGSQGRDRNELCECPRERITRTGGSSVSHANEVGRGTREQHVQAGESDAQRSGSPFVADRGRTHPAYRIWSPEPGVGRVAHGIPKRVDRLKGLGNAIVPQVAEQIFHAIKAADS